MKMIAMLSTGMADLSLKMAITTNHITTIPLLSSFSPLIIELASGIERTCSALASTCKGQETGSLAGQFIMKTKETQRRN